MGAAIAGRCAAEVKKRIKNLRRLHLLVRFLFGMFLANEMFALVREIENSAMSLSAASIDICEAIAVLARFVFGVLLQIARNPNPQARRVVFNQARGLPPVCHLSPAGSLPHVFV
jgi:hypothetical protein